MKKRPCTLRILDEVACIFVGLHPDHIAYFYEEYAVFAANYYFNPKFKLGSWDGKIRFFYKTGETFVHLLDDILPRVINLGYDVKMQDLRTAKAVFPDPIDEHFFDGVTHHITGEPWIMRDYQVDMVNKLLEYGSGVGIAGTGAGKTSMTAALALSYQHAADFRSIIIVPDKNLTDQTFREYANFKLDVGQYGAGTKDGNHQHVVSTWQTLKNNPTFIQEFDTIIVDEAHGLKGQVLQKLLNKYGKDIPYRFGVTGTIPKSESDALSVKVSVGPTRYKIPAHVLQEMEHLAQLHIDVFQHILDFRQQYDDYLQETLEKKPSTYREFVDDYFPDYTSEKAYLQANPLRAQWIADYIIAKHELNQGNVLCLVNGVRFGQKIAKLIPDAVFLSGKDKMEDRRAIYDQFQVRDDVTVIATTQIASTGLDIPRIFNLIGVDMGKSFVRTIQSIGRGLRKAADKDKVHYTDVCSDLKYSRRHLTERKKYFKEAKYKFKVHTVDLSEHTEDNDLLC